MQGQWQQAEALQAQADRSRRDTVDLLFSAPHVDPDQMVSSAEAEVEVWEQAVVDAEKHAARYGNLYGSVESMKSSLAEAREELETTVAEAEEIRDVEARGDSAHEAATDAQAQAAEALDAAERATATAVAGLTGAERDLDRALALEADHEEARRGEVAAAHASWAAEQRGVRARNAVRSACRADAAWPAGGAGVLVAGAAGVVLVPLARRRRG